MAAGGAKNKILSLLQDLALSDPGVDEGLLTGPEDAEADTHIGDDDEPIRDLLSLSPGRAAAFARRPATADSMTSLDSSIDTTIERDTQTRYGRHRASALGDKNLYMERKVLQLMHDNKALQLHVEQLTRRKDMEIAELQAQLNSTVRELDARQSEIEARAPIMKLRAGEFRERLKDLRISDAQYAELRQMSAESLHVVDEVKCAVYEATQELRRDNERLRLTIGTTRESAARAEEEAAKFRVENSRLSAALVEKEKDLQLAAEGMQSRVERLASELESSMVRAELLSAKGQMYDELKAKADALAEDNARLKVVEATFKRLETQAHELQLYAKEKEHTFEMLMMDKAYLSKQVEFLTDSQRKLQGELEAREARIIELTKAKQELFEKLVQTESLKNRQEEARLQKELAALQASTHADIERIRLETAEAYEREARLLRELRDQAQEEAARSKAALAELQNTHEQHQLTAAEIQRRLEAQVLELQGELRQRSFELSHVRVVVGEKEALLQRAQLQAEMAQEKLQVSLDRYRALEAEVTAAGGVARPLTALAQATIAASAAAATSTDGRSSSQAPGGGLGLETVAGGKSVLELQAQVLQLKQEKERLEAQVSALESSLRAAQEGLRAAGQPHAFLLAQLQEVKAGSEADKVKMVALQAALKVRDNQVSELTSERDALRRDLDALLGQRAQLDGLKQVLMRAMGASAGQSLTAPGAAARKPSGPLAQHATTIIGEGDR